MEANIKRRRSHAVNVGGVGVGGDNPIRVQSMTNTDTADIEGSVQQILDLYLAGAEMARITVNQQKQGQAAERIERLEQAVRAALPDWSLAEVVTALMAMRGIDLVSAAAFLAEIGDLSRFQTPRQLMAYLGLVPAEHSSGRTRRQGGITKAGNGAARCMLIEAAWCYRFPARISLEQLLRQERLAKPIRDSA